MQPKTDFLTKCKGLLVEFGFTISGILIFLSVIPKWEPKQNWITLFLYTLLTVIASFSPVRTLNSLLTVNSAVIFSGILIFGTEIGVWSAVIETLVISFLVRMNLVKAFANVGLNLITIWIVGVLKQYLELIINTPMVTDLLLAFVYWGVNISLCAIGISYFFNLKWLPTLKNLAKGTTLTYLLIMVIAGISSRLVELYGFLALLPILSAFTIMGFVFHQYYSSLNKLQQKVEEVKTFNHKFLTAMAASIDARDHYTSGHSQRVAYWGREIAKAIGLPQEKVEEVYFGGILHDIGKIGIEDEILNKEGKLTPEEYDKIKQHTVIGYEIMQQAGWFNELLPAIRSHHERIDGRGYPDGLRGEEIPLVARILAISDAFDAMVADRPYRKGLPIEKALEEIRQGAGSQFDEELARHFIAIIDRLPKEELEAMIRQQDPTHRQLQEAFN